MEKQRIGVVVITTNLLDGKRFVGIYAMPADRLGPCKLGDGVALLRAIRAHGYQSFVYEGPDFVEVRAKLIERHDATASPDFYNIRPRASPHYLGKAPSAATRERLRRASTGRRHSEETKEMIRLAAAGRKCSEETKQKLREAWVRRRARRTPER